MINTIFFDLDDTLYDRAVPFINAYKEFLNAEDNDLAVKAFKSCTARGNEVFLPSQRGEISMEEMYIYRYVQGFKDVGIYISDEQALKFQKLYKLMQGRIELAPGAAVLLDYCCTRFVNTGIITNGPAKHQWDKIHQLGILKYTDEKHIFISGEIGIDKPDLRIFKLALESCRVEPEQVIYVGDSYENDIVPAMKMGFESIWIDKNNERSNVDCSGFKVADSLEQVKDYILEGCYETIS